MLVASAHSGNAWPSLVKQKDRSLETIMDFLSAFGLLPWHMEPRDGQAALSRRIRPSLLAGSHRLYAGDVRKSAGSPR